jgi:hypothetical protein
MHTQILLGSQSQTGQLLLVFAFFLPHVQQILQLDESLLHFDYGSSAVDQLNNIIGTLLYLVLLSR